MAKQRKYLLLFAADITVVLSSIVTGLLLRFEGNIPAQYTDSLLLTSSLYTSIALTMNIVLQCYSSALIYPGTPELLKQFMASICTALIITILKNINILDIPNSVIIISSLIQFMLMSLVRFSGRLLRWFDYTVRLTGDSRRRKRALIIGGGYTGALLIGKLISNPKEVLRPMVVIDDRPELRDTLIGGIKVYGDRSKIPEAAKKFNVEEIVIAIPSANKKTIRELYEICKTTKCRIRRFSNITDIDDFFNLGSKALVDVNLEDLLSRDEIRLNHTEVAKFIRNRTVLVTGAAGSIGSEICRQVLGFGCFKLVAFDFDENGLFNLENSLLQQYPDHNMNICLGSIRDNERLAQVFGEFKPDVVFHAAAHKHVPMMEKNVLEAIKNNIFGTMNVIKAAIAANTSRFVLISTDKAVNPTNIMGVTKRVAELIAQRYNRISKTEIAAVRFGNVLGSNGSVIPIFRKQIEAGGPVTVTHRDIKRYFMTIPEAVQLVLQAGAFAKGGEIFVLDMGEPVRIYDLACEMIRLAGYEPFKDIEIKITGLRPGEKLFEELCLDDESVTKTTNDKIFVMNHDPDNEPHDLDDILEKILSALNSYNISLVKDLVRHLVPTFTQNTSQELASMSDENLLDAQPDNIKVKEGGILNEFAQAR